MIDYFAFYGLPVTFNPDTALIKQRFYEFSKKYHPDFYINEGEEKQAEVLELSTINNRAYQILSDSQKRLHYILELKELLKEGEGYVLPQGFLMEMMDVNEALMDLQMEPDPVGLEKLKSQVDAIEKSLAAEISAITISFDAQIPAEQVQSLAALKDLYYRNKYLFRIREGINKASALL